jgi:hypothetical protein
LVDVVNREDLWSSNKLKAVDLLNVCFFVDQFGNMICPLAANSSLAHADAVGRGEEVAALAGAAGV